jgi:signal transduction histidine kinase
MHWGVMRLKARLSESQIIRVEMALGVRAATGILSQLALFSAFRWLLPFPGPVPSLVDKAGCGFVIVAIVRWSLFALQRKRGSDPVFRRYWLPIFRMASLLMAACWSAISITMLYRFGLSIPYFLSGLIILGTASVAVQAFGLDLIFIELFVAILVLPTVIALYLTSEQPGHFAIAISFTIAWIYLAFLATSTFKLLCEALEAREVIQVQRDQLTAVLDSIPGYVLWTDAEGRYLGMNYKLLDAYRLRLDDVIGKSAGSILENDPLTVELNAFLASFESERLMEAALRLPEGLRRGLVAMRKYQGTTGKQAVVIVMDIEERKRVQEELENARAQAQESARLAALGIMAGGIAHEINNPLQVIRGLATLLRIPGTDVPMAAKKIDQTIDRIGKIISGLRSYSRKDSEYPAEPVEIEPLITEIVEMARVSQTHLRVPIRVSPISKHLVVDGRRTEIGQILINLINNSVDAIKEQSEPWIQILVKDEGNDVSISVEDSGLGIPDSVAANVMLPFFTTKEIGKGTGLGLSISKAIAERHHGSLRLDREAAHTTFILTLPKHQYRKVAHA